MLSATLTDAQRLKFRLLAEGVAIADSASEALRDYNGDRSLSPADYASTSGVILELDDDVWVNAPIATYNPNFVQTTPFQLVFASEGFVLQGQGLSSRARFWLQPRYHATANEFGAINNYVITHGDRARLSPLRSCSMTCTFCNIPYDDPIAVYSLKPIEAMLAALRTALSDPLQPAQHLLISGGTPKPMDIGFVQEVYRSVLTTFPDIETDIMMVPLKNLLNVTELQALGVHQLSINIEVFNAQRAAAMMRQKFNHGLDYYLDFIAYTADILGPGRVRSMLMVGLEPMADTLRGVAAIIERGGTPVLSPFRPDPGTPLRNDPPPTALELEETFLRAQEMAEDAGIPLGPDCPPCTHNTLNFVSSSGPAHYRHARPMMV